PRVIQLQFTSRKQHETPLFDTLSLQHHTVSNAGSRACSALAPAMDMLGTPSIRGALLQNAQAGAGVHTLRLSHDLCAQRLTIACSLIHARDTAASNTT